MARYLERYVYDAVGNFQEMIHRGSDPAHPGWTRDYTCDEASLLEPGKHPAVDGRPVKKARADLVPHERMGKVGFADGQELIDRRQDDV